VATITPTNLSGTISLFKDLGRSEQAKELLQFYLESRASEGPKFFDLQENIFGGHVKDPDVRAAFDQRSSVGKVRRDPKLLLLNVARNKSWGSSDLEELAGVSADGFKSLFKATEGDELSSIISAALEFGRIGNASDDMKTIASNATAALRSIAAESAINARRLALYGISPDIQQ